MDKARSAISDFLHKDNKHDTSVHETVNPAVQNEHVTRTQHNELQTAVDREVHQDHYHTSVQPVKDREVLAEQHSHSMAPVEHREVHHGNKDHINRSLENERAQFQNTRDVGDVQHSHGTAPTVGGEHVHHHVHENIQPVIQKETVQPSVVHTTKPVHEVHHNEAKHHAGSTLPAVSMSEFQKQGGSLGGSEARQDHFAGEPQTQGGIGATIGGRGAHGTTSLTAKDGSHLHSHHGHGTDTIGMSALNGSTSTTGTTGKTGTHSQSHGSGAAIAGGTASAGATGAATGTTGTYGPTSSSATHGTTGTTHKKASFLDKLNPKKDADGDGKVGFMD